MVTVLERVKGSDRVEKMRERVQSNFKSLRPIVWGYEAAGFETPYRAGIKITEVIITPFRG